MKQLLLGCYCCIILLGGCTTPRRISSATAAQIANRRFEKMLAAYSDSYPHDCRVVESHPEGYVVYCQPTCDRCVDGDATIAVRSSDGAIVPVRHYTQKGYGLVIINGP